MGLYIVALGLAIISVFIVRLFVQLSRICKQLKIKMFRFVVVPLNKKDGSRPAWFCSASVLMFIIYFNISPCVLCVLCVCCVCCALYVPCGVPGSLNGRRCLMMQANGGKRSAPALKSNLI